MANYYCYPVEKVEKRLIATVSVPAGQTLHAGQIVLANALDTSIYGNVSVFTPATPTTATLGKRLAIVINGGWEQLADGRRPEGNPDYTQYVFNPGDVATIIFLDACTRFEISTDAVTVGGLTPTAGQVLYPVNGSKTLTLGTAVPAGTFSSLTVLATSSFRAGGQFGAQFISTLVVIVNDTAVSGS